MHGVHCNAHSRRRSPLGPRAGIGSTRSARLHSCRTLLRRRSSPGRPICRKNLRILEHQFFQLIVAASSDD